MQLTPLRRRGQAVHATRARSIWPAFRTSRYADRTARTAPGASSSNSLSSNARSHQSPRCPIPRRSGASSARCANCTRASPSSSSGPCSRRCSFVSSSCLLHICTITVWLASTAGEAGRRLCGRRKADAAAAPPSPKRMRRARADEAEVEGKLDHLADKVFERFENRFFDNESTSFAYLAQNCPQQSSGSFLLWLTPQRSLSTSKATSTSPASSAPSRRKSSRPSSLPAGTH